MASPIGVQLILCDAAQADHQTGKVHILGAGWSRTGSPTGPMAIAVLMKIPWDRANNRFPLKLSLCDVDGHAVEVSTPRGAQQVVTHAAVEVGRPPGVEEGTGLDASFALNVPPLPLAPGRYQWRLDINGQIHETSFDVNGGP